MSVTTLTICVKFDGVTIGLAEAPRTVGHGASFNNVQLLRVSLGSAHHHAGAKRDTVQGNQSNGKKLPASYNFFVLVTVGVSIEEKKPD